jgi:hypothetical protein
MKLHAKVVVATQQWPAIMRAIALATSACLVTVLLKFTTSEDHQATLQGCKGIVGTKLGLDKNLMPMQRVHKSKLWLLFKAAKAAGKRTFWHAAELFGDGIHICPPSSV